MADVILRTNAGYGPTDIILHTSAISVASPSGGAVTTLGRPRRKLAPVELDVDFSWLFTFTVDATIAASLDVASPTVVISGRVGPERELREELDLLLLLNEITVEEYVVLSDDLDRINYPT